MSLLELLKGEAPTSPVPLLVEAHGWTLLNEHLPEAVMQAWNALKNYSGELGAKLLADMFGLCTFNEGSTVQSAVTLTDWPGTTTDSITVRVEDVEALKCDDPRFLLLDELTKRPHVMSMLGLHAKQVAPAIPLQPLLEKVVVGETFQFVLVNGQRVAGRPSEWHKVSMGKIALASAPKVNGSGASIVADDLQVLGFLSNVDGCGFVSADAWGNCAGEYFWIHVPPNTRRNFVMICCDAEGEQSMVVTFTAIAVEEELFFVGWDPDRTFDASIAVVNDRIIDVTVREVIS